MSNKIDNHRCAQRNVFLLVTYCLHHTIQPPWFTMIIVKVNLDCVGSTTVQPLWSSSAPPCSSSASPTSSCTSWPCPASTMSRLWHRFFSLVLWYDKSQCSLSALTTSFCKSWPWHRFSFLLLFGHICRYICGYMWICGYMYICITQCKRSKW